MKCQAPLSQKERFALLGSILTFAIALAMPHGASAEIHGAPWGGPSGGSGRANAGILELLKSSKVRGGDRVLLVNGTTLYSRLSRSAEAPGPVLDRLEAQAHEDLADAGYLVSAESGVPSPFAKPYRADGEGWGVVGRLTGAGHLDDEDGILASLARGDGAGDTARDGFFVLATERQDGGSDIWSFRFDEHFNPVALLTPETADVAGGDLPGIERFPGSQRVMTLSELSELGNNHGVAYRAVGSTSVPTQRISHYHGQMIQNGYRLDSKKIEADHAMARYSSAEAEVTVMSFKSGAREVLDMIQLQPKEYQEQ